MTKQKWLVIQNTQEIKGIAMWKKFYFAKYLVQVEKIKKIIILENASNSVTLFFNVFSGLKFIRNYKF